MTPHKRLMRIALALVVALGFSTIMAAPALANTPSGYLYICNSTSSRGPVTVHPDVGGQVTIVTGACKQVNNAYGHTLVDPDPELGGDVDSTWWGFIGHGYDHCDPGEGWIDFPNTDPDGGGSEIRMNTDASGC